MLERFLDISDYDEVVGASSPAFGGSVTCQQVPYYWSESTGFVRLPMPPGYESWSAFPRHINNRRQIVGYLGIQEVAVLWEIRETCASDAAGIVTQLQGIVERWLGSGVLSHGRATALRAKLLAAGRSLAEGKATPARGQVIAFLNELRAFVNTGFLTADDTRVSFTCAERALEQLASP